MSFPAMSRRASGATPGCRCRTPGRPWGAGQLLVSESFAFRRGIGPASDRLTLLTDRGPQTFPVAGVYYDYSTDQGAVLMDATVYRAWYDDPWISSAALFLEAGASPDALLNRLREETLVGKNLLARANSELRADVFELFERTFLITGALQLLATGRGLHRHP